MKRAFDSIASAATVALIAALTWPALVAPAHAQQGITSADPQSVSAGWRAIFNSNKDHKGLKDRLNANTVSIVLGTFGGTYLNFGADMATALDDGDNLRIMPIVGKGSVRSIADILFLRGIDLGVVRTDTIEYLERKGYVQDIRGQLTYITKLYNSEVHVIAPKSIKRLQDLDGKRVAVDLPDGGTLVTAHTIFEALGIRAQYFYMEQRLAQDMLKRGELDAYMAVQGTPSRGVAAMTGDFHLVPIEYSPALQGSYFPATLDAKNYPTLIEPGKRVDTVSVPEVLAGYNWPENTERYRKMENFTNIFFERFASLQQPPYHPKWKEVALGAPLKGWERFKPAQAWLDKQVATASPEMRYKFDQFLAARGSAVGPRAGQEQNDVLFQQFLKWQESQTAPNKGRKH